MIKLFTSLKRPLGRFYKVMTDIALQYGIMCVPLSTVFLMFAIERNGWIAWALFVIGVIFMAIGLLSLRLNLKWNKDDTVYQHKIETMELQKWKAHMDLLLGIHEELKKISEELKSNSKQKE